MSSALDKSTKKAIRKKQIVTAAVFLIVVCSLFAYLYVRSIASTSKELSSKAPTKSTVNQPASAVGKQQKGEEQYLASDSPAKRVADAQEQEAKEVALEQGKSHVNSTAVIHEKTSQYEAQLTPPPLPEPPVKKQVAQQKKKQAPQPSKQQILTERVRALLVPNSAFPPAPNVTQLVATQMTAIDAIPFEKRQFAGGAQEQLTVIAAQISPEYKELGQNQSPQGRQASAFDNTNKEPNVKQRKSTEKENMIKVVPSGDMLLTELKWQVVSDFNLPVFFDVVEPPLQQMRLTGNFQMAQNQKGVLLRVTKLEMGDYTASVDGYGLDIGTDLSPLFDTDVDTHFTKRFLARASSAFVVPFLDFVKTSTTTITNGNVVVTQDPVTSTTDRVIGGVANVAAEFLPDLRQNANIPPTVTIPQNAPVGIVFSTPLFLPEKLLEEHGSSLSNRYYDYGANY